MVDKHETTPYRGDPDEFDLLIGELNDHMEDPYLVEIHNEARRCEDMLKEPGANNPVMRQELTNHLDAKWRYMNLPVEVTGNAVTKQPGATDVTNHMCIGETAISRGFIFLDINSQGSVSGATKICHFLEITADDGASRALAFLPLDNISQFNLPTPSPEGRERRFAYYHEEQANWLDEIAFTSPRNDQIIPTLREFYIDVNLDSKEGVEHLLDATEYMRRRAEIEPLANYRISVVGDAIVADSEGNGIPTVLKKPYTKPMHIKDIVLRPADITISKVEGLQRCIPFIEAVDLRETGGDLELLIPCTSIVWMHSMRYDTTL